MLKGLTALLAVAGTAGGVLVAGAPAGAEEWHDGSTVSMHATGSGITLSRSTVRAGQVRMAIDTTVTDGSNVLLFRPAPGVSLDTVFADFGEEFAPDPATDAKGTRDLTRDARFYGGGDVVPGTPVTVTETLRAGTYYVVDVAAPPGPNGPVLSALTVVGRNHDDGDDENGDSDHGSPTVRMTSDDRFVVRGHLRARGSLTVANVSDTLHFMDLTPVKPGTTDADVQAYFDSGSDAAPPFALDGPTIGMDVLSPGHHASLRYSVPRGTYVLLCFVSDDETGMPHALMGMHKVVVLS